MGKKWTEEKIKEYIEITSNSGYKFVRMMEEKEKDRIVVRCDKGHEYDVRFYNFKTGYRCPHCAKNIKHDLDYCKEVFSKCGYEILQDFYINSRTNIKYRCDKGHETEISLDNLQRGKRCRYCSNNLYFNEQELLNDLSKTKYSLLDKLDGLTKGNKYNFIDKNGYKYYTNLSTILKNGNNLRFRNTNPYTIYNINNWLKIEGLGKEYELISNTYKKKNQPISFKYIGEEWNFKEEERIFPINFTDFYKSKKHPMLKISLGEGRIKRFLEKNNLDFIREKTFEDLKYINKLKIDFFLTTLNIAIEFHGFQHERPIEHFGGELVFERQKKKDEIKRKFCLKNNIRLIEIYYDDLNNIEKILSKELEIKNE